MLTVTATPRTPIIGANKNDPLNGLARHGRGEVEQR